jgi:hypothetical protein
MTVAKILVLCISVVIGQVASAEATVSPQDITNMASCLNGLGYIAITNVAPDAPANVERTGTFSFDIRDANGALKGLYELTPAGARTVTMTEGAQAAIEKKPGNGSAWYTRYYDESKHQIVAIASGAVAPGVFTQMSTGVPATVTDTNFANISKQIGAIVKSNQEHNTPASVALWVIRRL